MAVVIALLLLCGVGDLAVRPGRPGRLQLVAGGRGPGGGRRAGHLRHVPDHQPLPPRRQRGRVRLAAGHLRHRWPRSAATSPTPNRTWSPKPSPPPSPWPCWPCWKGSRATPARSPAWPPGRRPGPRGRARPARPAPPSHHRPTHRHHRQPGHRGGGPRRPAARTARRTQPSRQHHGRGAAAGRLCAAAAGRPGLDGPHPGRGGRLWPQQRRQLPATPAPPGCGAHP